MAGGFFVWAVVALVFLNKPGLVAKGNLTGFTSRAIR